MCRSCSPSCSDGCSASNGRKVKLGQQPAKWRAACNTTLSFPFGGSYLGVEHLHDKREGQPGEIPNLGRAFYLGPAAWRLREPAGVLRRRADRRSESPALRVDVPLQ